LRDHDTSFAQQLLKSRIGTAVFRLNAGWHDPCNHSAQMGRSGVSPAGNNQPEKHMTITPPTHHRGGFTLIEMLLVLVILGILAGIVVPQFAGKPKDARITATKGQITGLKTALAAFEMDNGYFPRGVNALQALAMRPPDANNWKGPYMEQIPLDAWGHAFVYECPGKYNTATYDLTSAGPDEKLNSEDDIANWQK
jgi:general secretion pathway protein G